MATTYKVLGQEAPAATTDTTLYTVPSSTNTVVSTLSVANRGITTTFRVAVRPNGASISNEHYIVYDATIAAGDSIFLTLGITLEATDIVSIYAGTANLSFGLFGSEIT